MAESEIQPVSQCVHINWAQHVQHWVSTVYFMLVLSQRLTPLIFIMEPPSPAPLCLMFSLHLHRSIPFKTPFYVLRVMDANLTRGGFSKSPLMLTEQHLLSALEPLEDSRLRILWLKINVNIYLSIWKLLWLTPVS
jgi:hypothetical protein